MEKIKLYTIRIGDHMHICDSESLGTIKDQAKKAIEKGSTVRWEDGKEEWIEVRPIIDTSKEGADCFTWDKSGNRIKCERVRYIRNRDQTIDITVVKALFQDYSRVFED